jgi:hypothetical protein
LAALSFTPHWLIQFAAQAEIRTSQELVLRLTYTNDTCELESIICWLETNENTAAARAAVSFAFLVDATREDNFVSLQVEVPILAAKILICT